MDDARIGRICRALRRRRGWRQTDLAERARCHQTTISRLERGGVAGLRLEVTRGIFLALGASFDGLVGWRAGDLDRILDERHAAIVETVARRLTGIGWAVVPELTYAIWGERGSIDLLAGHPATRAVAVLEIKSDITRVEEVVRRHDEKVRHAAQLAQERFDWRPASVGRILVLLEEPRLRRLVGDHEVTFRAA